MSYKVCIPTAGTGSRLGEITRYLNKSLIAIANRPTICHLIEHFPADAKFVIALGHKGNLVQEFLGLAYPTRNFEYVNVDPYEGECSGLGLSLIACKKYLQEPFVFTSCDTLVEGVIPQPNRNWMGYADKLDLEPYRTIKITNSLVIGISEKGEGKTPEYRPYIGLAGIFDYQVFWTEMERGGQNSIQAGEAFGLRALLVKGIGAEPFVWHDTGNIDALNKARNFYRNPDEPNILEKANEAIWFVGENVIKFSDDKKFITNRVKRAKELEGYVPSITGSGENMYCYSKVPGKVFSDVVNLPLFKELLKHSIKFWKLKEFNEQEQMAFKHTCMLFYRDKTYERIEIFYKKFFRKDGIESINGEDMPLLKTLLGEIDWDWLADGLPSRFHGDYHFENIIWTASSRKFTFVDWRQDFGGDLSTGDVYYDLAKIFHGLIINHEIVDNEHYEIEWLLKSINFDIYRKHKLIGCESLFNSWLDTNNFDKKKIRILSSLIYLNIAALHHDSYALLLYALGKSMLKKEIES